MLKLKKNDCLALDDYEALYDTLLILADEADGFTSYDTDEDTLQKCRWIEAMLQLMEDVPKSKAEYIFKSHISGTLLR